MIVNPYYAITSICKINNLNIIIVEPADDLVLYKQKYLTKTVNFISRRASTS